MSVTHAVVFLSVLACGHEAVADTDPSGQFRRQGFMIGIGVGGSFMHGLNVDEVNGFGGAFTLRIGTTANETTLWVLQLDTAAAPNRNLIEDEAPTVDQLSTITLGAQHYLRQVLWLKGGLGVAILSRNLNDDEAETSADGLGLMASVGYDIARLGIFVVNAEGGLNLAAIEDGLVLSVATRLTATWY